MRPILRPIFALFLLAGACLAQAPAQPKTPKAPPQAKTKAEFKDYNAALAASGGAALEKAADDFAKKYPNSELRSILYVKAMGAYEAENNPPKILAMGEKVLGLDPDNASALVMTATVLSDSLGANDADRDAKIAEARKNAQHALQTLDSMAAPAGASPEQLAAYKQMLEALAHSALGIVDLKTGDDAGAEAELQQAANINQAAPDPYVWYHLALAQDHQKKYKEALASVERALQYISSSPSLETSARGEHARLLQLTAPQ